MSLNLSNLSLYTDEQKMALIKRSVLEGRTTRLITVQPDIKSSAEINIIGSTLVAQAGACGFNASGTTNLTQETLSVCPLKVNESICLDDLEKYYTQKLMKAGSYNEEIPFEAIFASEKSDKIQSLVEDLIWKSSTAGSGQLALCDGFNRKFDTVYSASTINGNPGGLTALTASNIIGAVDAMTALVPADVIAVDDLHLFVGYDVYRLYSLALRNANLFAYTGAENQGQDFSQMIPGTNIRMIAVRGLNGTNRMVLTPASNLYFGTDLLNDYESFKIFYSEDNQEVRFVAKWKQGVAVAFPEFVVNFKLV
jgi:hypothetical protein